MCFLNVLDILANKLALLGAFYNGKRTVNIARKKINSRKPRMSPAFFFYLPLPQKAPQTRGIIANRFGSVKKGRPPPLSGQPVLETPAGMRTKLAQPAGSRHGGNNSDSPTATLAIPLPLAVPQFLPVQEEGVSGFPPLLLRCRELQ